MRHYIYLFLLLIGLALLYIFVPTNPSTKEGFSNARRKCPDLLIQKGIQIYLYNTRVGKVPGVNPVIFSNLEEYTEYVDWQHSQGIHCPVLFLQHSYDAQGQSTYRVRPSPYDLQGGLPPNSANQVTPLTDASRDDSPYNQNSLPAYDSSSQNIGTTTPLDLMDKQQGLLSSSPNAMDDNWGGPSYTQELVDEGYYKGNEVNIYVP